jgi:hypothetical protein
MNSLGQKVDNKMPAKLKQLNKACGYIGDCDVLCTKQAWFGKANPTRYCQKYFLKWQQANLEKLTSGNNGGAPWILNVNGNEPVHTDGGINSICINEIPMIERDKMVNFQATAYIPSGN